MTNETTAMGDWIEHDPSRDWLSEDVWLSIPEYMQKFIQNAHMKALDQVQSDTEARYAPLVEAVERLTHWASEVNQILEDHGPSIVGHLMDSDDNAGQFMRNAIAHARQALDGLNGGEG